MRQSSLTGKAMRLAVSRIINIRFRKLFLPVPGLRNQLSASGGGPIAQEAPLQYTVKRRTKNDALGLFPEVT